MTNRLPPNPEDFAAAARQRMIGRKWSWLSVESGINAGPLRRQLITHPESLKFRTAISVARVLELSVWGDPV